MRNRAGLFHNPAERDRRGSPALGYVLTLVDLRDLWFVSDLSGYRVLHKLKKTFRMKLTHGCWEKFSVGKISQSRGYRSVRSDLLGISSAVFALITLCGCGQDMPPIRLQMGMGDPAPAPSLRGLIAAGEPEAVLAAKDIMTVRGNAADASAALAMTLSVTLPSRAGLTAGGECLVRDPSWREVLVLSFGGRDADRRAPTLARGMFALQARFGKRPWAQVIAPAEKRARFGVMVSRALANDLATSGSILIENRAAFLQFSSPRRQLLAIGERLQQPQLAATLGEMRARGPQVVTEAPAWTPVTLRDQGGVAVFRHDSVAAAGGVGTAFTVADANGLLVSCVISMGAPFGDGRIVADTGFTGSTRPSGGSLAFVMNGDTGEPRAAVAGPAARVAAFTESAALGRKRLADIKATVGAGPGALPVAAWACPSGLQSDGRACESFTQPDSAGYALVVLPED